LAQVDQVAQLTDQILLLVHFQLLLVVALALLELLLTQAMVVQAVAAVTYMAAQEQLGKVITVVKVKAQQALTILPQVVVVLVALVDRLQMEVRLAVQVA
jgi:hypothetical protein